MDALDRELNETPIGLNTRLEKVDTHYYRGSRIASSDWNLIIEIKYPHGTKEVCRETYPGKNTDGRKKRKWAKRRTKHWQDLYGSGLLN